MTYLICKFTVVAPAGSWEFCVGRSDILLEFFKCQMPNKLWKSFPHATEMELEIPVSIYLMKRKKVKSANESYSYKLDKRAKESL